MDTKKLVGIVLKNVNVKGLALDLIDGYVEPLVMELAKKTTNTLDDSLAKLLIDEAKELIEKKLSAPVA